MLVIRLQRTGRENLPTYRIVVAEKARPVKGKYQEIVGHYMPAQDPAVLKFETERIEHWIGKGAIPSDTVARLLKKSGVKNMDKYIVRYTKQKTKDPEALAAMEAAAAAAKAPAPAAEAAPAAPAPEATPAA